MSKRFRVAYIIITFLPTIWFPLIINWLGEHIGLIERVEGKTQPTFWGWVFSVIVFSLVIIFNIKHYLDSNRPNYESIAANNEILSRLEDSLRSLCKKRGSQYLQHIENNVSNFNIISLCAMHDPIRCIHDLINEMVDFFVVNARMRKDQINVTFAYTFGDSVWMWSDGRDTANIYRLLRSEHTAFYQAMYGKKPIVYYNSKQQANKKGAYTYNERDVECDKIGSIICAKVRCGRSTQDCAVGVLTISTYGRHLFIKDDVGTMEFMKEQILKSYIERVRLELTLLYAKQLVTISTAQPPSLPEITQSAAL